MDIIERMLDGKKIIIGMVHYKALPGTPKYEGKMDEVVAHAVNDAVTLEKAGVNAIMVENAGDAPNTARMEINQIAGYAAVAMMVRQAVSLPMGISAAFNDWKAGLSIAVAVGAQFIRSPVFVDTVISSTGMVNPCAKDALLFRKFLDADDIKILADVQVKHTFMLAPERKIEDSAVTAQKFGADALIVTGTGTGVETPIDVIKRVKNVVNIPVLVGSGFDANNAKSQMEIADGAIVGSAFKENGIIKNPVSFELVRKIMEKING